MPSSTSSSDSDVRHAVPSLDARAVVSGVLIAMLLLAAIELGWRRVGYRPSLADTPALWAEQRARITGDPRAVALLGDSRMQVGFSLEAFRARHPDRSVAQLAIVGRPPVATLEDLASDEDFVGTVIVALRAEHLMPGYRPTAPQREVIEYRERWRPASRWPYHDAAARLGLFAAFQSRLVLLNPDLALDRLIRGMLEHGSLPAVPYSTLRRDRSRRSDYAMIDVASRRRQLELLADNRKPMKRGGGRWERRAANVKRAIRKIEARGGRVILVRLPSSPERFRSESRNLPRAQFWDRLATESPVTLIHYRDVPGLAAFIPADSAHLDFRDSAPFTNALLDEIEARGLLPALDSAD